MNEWFRWILSAVAVAATSLLAWVWREWGKTHDREIARIQEESQFRLHQLEERSSAERLLQAQELDRVRDAAAERSAFQHDITNKFEVIIDTSGEKFSDIEDKLGLIANNIADLRVESGRAIDGLAALQDRTGNLEKHRIHTDDIIQQLVSRQSNTEGVLTAAGIPPSGSAKLAHLGARGR